MFFLVLPLLALFVACSVIPLDDVIREKQFNPCRFVECPLGYKCHDDKSCLQCVSECDSIDCLQCPLVKRCGNGEKTLVIKGRCEVACPAVACVPKGKPCDNDCLMCPQVFPTCPQCPKGTHCVIHKQTCHKCAHATCKVADPWQDCPVPNRVMLPTNNNGSKRHCIDCSLMSITAPKCACKDPEDCLYQHRLCANREASYACLSSCKACPAEASSSACSRCPGQCILEPRTCESCAQWYCSDECTPCTEEIAECPCEDKIKCMYRERTCFSCGYWEC